MLLPLADTFQPCTLFCVVQVQVQLSINSSNSVLVGIRQPSPQLAAAASSEASNSFLLSLVP